MSQFRRGCAIIGAAALVLLGTCSAPIVPAHLREPAALTMPTATARPEAPAPEAPAATAAPPTPTPEPSPTPLPPAASSQIRQDIDAYLTGLTADGWFMGAVLVARGDQLIHSKAYGMADVTTGAPNTTRTRFRLASLTKQFTAVAIMILQARGQLNIGDPICDYLENCPDAWRPVTIRHLLNHTSGIVDYTDFLDYEATESQPATPQQLVARFRDFPLAYPPGELYDYCNSGYVLLGLIIERASGQAYGDFLRSAIFEPLGMRDTGYESGPVADQAAGHWTSVDKSSFLDPTTLYAAGGLYSTIDDMYRWDQALYTEQLLPQAMLAEMWTPGNGSYGYGWKILYPNGHLQISHAGNMTGVSNFIARYPDDRLTIIVLSNLELANSAAISDQIAAMVFGQ